MATTEARGSAGPGGRGESPGARALRRGRRDRWANAHRVWRLLAPAAGRGRAQAGGALPLGRSVVGAASVGQTAPQTAPAQRCGPGRALCARVGGAQRAGPGWGGSPLRPRLRRDADPCTSGSRKPRAGYMCSGLLRRPRRFCVQSQGPSRLLRAAVPESNRHVQALGWVWYGCQASRHSSRLLRESRVRGDG